MLDTPPPPQTQCISRALVDKTEFSTRLIVSGNPRRISSFLEEVAKQPLWEKESDTSGVGVRMVSLIGPVNVEYRYVGGLIYEAQHLRLAIALVTNPPICGMLL